VGRNAKPTTYAGFVIQVPKRKEDRAYLLSFLCHFCLPVPFAPMALRMALMKVARKQHICCRSYWVTRECNQSVLLLRTLETPYNEVPIELLERMDACK